ncbi:MAG: amidohydrolase family protein [Desulfurococcales archaeon]|nr:amidohydrolase family protein [Desulfurococcales archaeon]
MAKTRHVKAGLLLRGENLAIEEDRCIHIRGEIIESIETISTCPLEATGSGDIVALPQPGLAHVHSGDHLFPEYGVDEELAKLVAPPNGLKHRLLAGADDSRLEEAILEYYRMAWRLGNGLLIDFREGGGHGCLIAKKALEKAPQGIRVVVLGRPGPGFPHGCDGLGLSSPLDHSKEELLRLVASNRPAFTHVAETKEAREKGDLELAIEAGFDAIVHGTYLSRGDLGRLREKGVGLVMCPRSNLWHGVGIPPVRDALETVGDVALGSDNAAWMPPNPWREAETALLLARLEGPTGEWLARRVLEALFISPYKLVGLRPRIIGEGWPARFLLYMAGETGLTRSRSLVYGLVKRVFTGYLVGRVDDGELSLL